MTEMAKWAYTRIEKAKHDHRYGNSFFPWKKGSLEERERFSKRKRQR
jgi:hypothetical protein